MSLYLNFLLSRKAYSHVQQLSSVLLWQIPVLRLYLPWLTLDSQPSFSRFLFIVFFIVWKEAPENLKVITGNTRCCTNPGRQVNWATKFCTFDPNICGYSALNLHHDTLLMPRILIWFLNFWNICGPLRNSPPQWLDSPLGA